MENNKNKTADIRIETHNLYDLKGILRNLKKVFVLSKPISQRRDEGGYYHYITVCEKSGNQINKVNADSISTDTEPYNTQLNENELEMLYYFRKVSYRQQLKTIGNLEMMSMLPAYTCKSANQINEEIVRSPKKYGEWILENIEAVKNNDEAFFDILDFNIPAEKLRNEYMNSMTNEEWEKLDYIPELNAIVGDKIETTMEMQLKRQLGIDNIMSGCVSQEEKESYCTLFNTLLSDVFLEEWDIRKEQQLLYNIYRKTREKHIRKLYEMLVKNNISFTNAKEIGNYLVYIIALEK